MNPKGEGGGHKSILVGRIWSPIYWPKRGIRKKVREVSRKKYGYSPLSRALLEIPDLHSTLEAFHAINAAGSPWVRKSSQAGLCHHRLLVARLRRASPLVQRTIYRMGGAEPPGTVKVGRNARRLHTIAKNTPRSRKYPTPLGLRKWDAVRARGGEEREGKRGRGCERDRGI